ncbi:MAG TPA: hypothetical protein HA349_09280 [Methanotrichaceae archaeon]|nr:hypothetical protein [Methanotrichaceae archaeon]
MREDWHAERIGRSEEFWRSEQLDSAAAFQTARCIEISSIERRSLKVDVAIEERIAVILDGITVLDLFCLPSQLEELAVGHLVCEGLIDGFDDLVSVRTEGKALICECRGRKFQKDVRPIVSDLKMSSDAIFRAVDLLNERALLWRRTGGIHSALVLREDGKVTFFCEDVSRSSALDKAARAEVPILASRAAPLNAGIELARRLGMTFAAFAKRPNLYVHSGEERIS